MEFQLISDIAQVEIIARSSGIKDVSRLNRVYGKGNWRKLKGIAEIQLASGKVRRAEVHWYEAHGIGKKEIKRKRYVDEYESSSNF